MTAAATACSDAVGPGISGDCDLVVHVNAIVYAVDRDLAVPADFTPGDAHATVAAQKDIALPCRCASAERDRPRAFRGEDSLCRDSGGS